LNADSAEPDDGTEVTPALIVPPDTEMLSFLARPLGPGFRATVVTLECGTTLAYDESEWRGALVVVEAGEVDLECRAGGRRRFRPGAVLWMTGLDLRALHSVGADPAVLVAVSRRDPGPAT
jgi:hypothetical protein